MSIATAYPVAYMFGPPRGDAANNPWSLIGPLPSQTVVCPRLIGDIPLIGNLAGQPMRRVAIALRKLAVAGIFIPHENDQFLNTWGNLELVYKGGQFKHNRAGCIALQGTFKVAYGCCSSTVSFAP